MVKEIKNMMNEIYDKDFKISFRGYKRQEVDAFLDEISELLELTIKNLKKQRKMHDEMLKENLTLKSQLIKQEKQLEESKKNKELETLLVEKKLAQMEQQIRMLKGDNLM